VKQPLYFHPSPQGSRMKLMRQLRRLEGRVFASRGVIFEAVSDNLSFIKIFDFNFLVSFYHHASFFEKRDPPALN
jgi:hypothetical protein